MADLLTSRLNENTNEENSLKVEKLRLLENMNFEDPEDYVDDIMDEGYYNNYNIIKLYIEYNI